MGKLFFYFFSFLLIFSNSLNAQILEKFDDGNFSQNPQWKGNETEFIINGNRQLQSNSTTTNHSFYLSTPNNLALPVQWDFFIQLNFNPSSANYVDVFLNASASDLSAASTFGYFVRIGNTDDEISLYRKNENGIITKIIDGADGLLNKSNNVMKIRVIRNASNDWSLLSDITGMGNSYISQGNAIDATSPAGNYFGFFIKQSTSSFFQKHFFDDIEIKEYVPDVMAPKIQSVVAVTNKQVDIWFDESLDPASAQLFSNYSANNGLGMPVSASLDATNAFLVHLYFENTFTNGLTYTITINGVKDITGNAISNSTASFSFYTPQQYDIVIDELIADPSPSTGLPNSEWVELKNTSSFPVNLQGWRLGDISGGSGVMPNFILEPDSFVIVCTGSAVAALTPFGKTISITNFPSLHNEGQLIFLSDANGKTIHALEYSVEWYQDDLKKEGGWSLEMIDTHNPCAGAANWKASNHSNGGTPGKLNSVNGTNNDQSPPQLLRAFAVNETTITLMFDEPLDSAKAAIPGNYIVDNSVSVIEALPIFPLFNKVNITLANPLVAGTIYWITTKNIADCKGNLIGEKNRARFGLPQEAESLDLIVNEILFNPLSPGVDYVEIYNRSKKIIDVSNVYLANRNSSNEISSVLQVSDQSLLLFPESFLLVTTDVELVKSKYTTTNPEAFFKMKSFPSFADDKGNVILLNKQGEIVDEVAYSEKWHFPLITNPEGVSLERIDYNGSSTQLNFHSASTSSGYGTPGYKNSQIKPSDGALSQIKISPEIFSPDNDGIDDFVTIDYSFPLPGFVTNTTIFDATGKPVRYLQKNSLGGLQGYYRWEGLDDKNRRLPQGIYIIYTEIFNTGGNKKSFKNTVVLARKY